MTSVICRIFLTTAALAASAVLGMGAPAQADDAMGVYRFWSPEYDNAHFYTMDSSEAAQIRATNRNWVYEGVAFRAIAASGGGCSTGSPVWRFWSTGYRTHFYTSDKSEMESVRATNSNWAFEGIAYCAYLSPGSGTIPLYRFWSDNYRKHFYTADKSESDQLRATNPNWSYEGIAYHVFPDNGSSPAPPPLPSRVLNLTNWKLTLPIGPDNDPTEIVQPELDSYLHPQWFFSNASGDGVVFRADTSGATTQNSDFPRSELREMAGSSRASWSNTDGRTHTMSIVQAITHLPDRVGDIDPVVAGQIHDGSDDVLVLRVQKVPDTQKIRLRARGTSMGVDVELDPAYTLGTKFKIEFKAVNGTITMTYWKSASATTPTSSAFVTRSGSGWFFKAGCYTQATTNPSSGFPDRYGTGYGEVIVYDVAFSHN